MSSIDGVERGDHQPVLIYLELLVPAYAAGVERGDARGHAVGGYFSDRCTLAGGVIGVIAAFADLPGDEIVQALVPHHFYPADLPLDLVVDDGAADEQHQQHD